jgi:hypothetical protein
MACSVWPESDAARLARALAGAARTRCAVTVRTIRAMARLAVAHRWMESSAVFG